MAKRQSIIGKGISAAMALEMMVSDPIEKEWYRNYIINLRCEWVKAGRERRFPHQSRDAKAKEKGKE